MKNINEAKALTRFTPKAATLLATATKGEESARKAAQAAYDRMVSDGMFWTDWLPVKAEGSTATPELREALFAARRKGFGAWAPKLFATPNKALSEDQIVKKNKLRTDLNKKITDDKEAMRLRLDKVYAASKSKAKTKAPQPPKTGDKVVDDSNVVNAKICKKIRDLQTYIEGNAPVKDSNDSRELLRGMIEIFTQQVSH
tara:strand:- start:207 stop:806 length:600 start_codon:yes stop_codon:yes gene_type:complete